MMVAMFNGGFSPVVFRMVDGDFHDGSWRSIMKGKDSPWSMVYDSLWFSDVPSGS